ncbi:MAG: hypothetical protein AB1798_15115 [Spirochaetota bacterium]
MLIQSKIDSFFAVPQDLHIHTTFSSGDNAVVPEQTVELIAAVRHAQVIGISDHFEYITGEAFEGYAATLRRYQFKVGTEVNGAEWVKQAAEVKADYYVYHCRDVSADYSGAETLLSTGKPVIIAHPQVLETNLDKLPPDCYIEVNNRYVWKYDWRNGFKKFISRFRFVLGSDAHQPNWLNLNISRYVAKELGIPETLLFSFL